MALAATALVVVTGFTCQSSTAGGSDPEPTAKLRHIVTQRARAPKVRPCGGRAVWYAPDDDSPDLINMFTEPNLWRDARRRIAVFKLGPQHFEATSRALRRNFLGALNSAGAFKLLQEWGIALASEEGAVKEWDCVGHAAASATARHINNLKTLGVMLSIVSLDEPLVSGLGPCKLNLADTARNTGQYIRDVRAAAQIAGVTPPTIGDIEPYPSFPLSTLLAWIAELSADAPGIAFLHLDIDLNYVHAHPEFDVHGDLEKLQKRLRELKIPFGIIIWSGRDPVATDMDYYSDASELVRLVKSLPSLPDQLIFESWVTRAPVSCSWTHTNCSAKYCSSIDPYYCGEKSIPLNLPDAGPNVYSHTKLVVDSLKSLTW
jgi:hypothetical protein